MTSTQTHLVSVVIPCYNQVHYLGEAIESVLAQSHRDFEIVVVDDGSPDSTAEVAARYEGVRVVRQENRGLPAARNAGFGASAGDYVVFLDADDRLLPRALETNLERLRANPNCAFVYGYCHLIAEDGAPLPPIQQRNVEQDHYLNLLRHNYIYCPAAVMYRRATLEAVGGFDASLKSSEDYELYLRIARTRSICCSDDFIADYRKHDSSMSRNAERMLCVTRDVLRAQLPYVRKDARLREAYRAGLRYSTETYGEHLVDKVRTHVRAGGEWKQALRGAFTLLRYYPRGVTDNVSRKLRVMVFGASE